MLKLKSDAFRRSIEDKKRAMFHIEHGDNLAILRSLTPNSFDAMVTDPPCGIAFMGKDWDKDKGGRDEWIRWMAETMAEALRVLKPGAHALVWAIPRTQHWTMMALENAGFIVRDVIYHMHGMGFPKNRNLKKDMDKEGMLCQCHGHEEEKIANLPDMSEGIQAQEQYSFKQSEVLQRNMLRDMAQQQPKNSEASEEDSIFGTCSLDRREHSELQGKNVRRQKPSMDGRPLRRARKGIRDDSETGAPESESQWLRPGTYFGDGEEIETPPSSGRSGTSQKSQSIGQPNKQSSALCDAQRTLGKAPQERLHCSKCSLIKEEKVEGFGTALKPSCEPWILVQKPLSENTIAANVLKHGTGGLNIDESRIALEAGENLSRPVLQTQSWKNTSKAGVGSVTDDWKKGRFPANCILDEDAAKVLDEQTGDLGKSSGGSASTPKGFGEFGGGTRTVEKRDPGFGDSGGASRFFYTAKASKSEKGEGNGHPTVKPIKLMEYLIKLITPPGGTVLDPFMGSGTTGVAAIRNGFKFFGIDQDKQYSEIAIGRLFNEYSIDPKLILKAKGIPS